MTKSKGEVLRTLGGGSVRITTYHPDWETRKIGDGANAGLAVGMSLTAFLFQDFRETKTNSDMWEFKVRERTPDGKNVDVRVFIHGEDIFLVSAISAISVGD